MPLSRDEFLKRVTDSGLLTADMITESLADLPVDRQPKDGEQLAQELVKLKLLTKFQAEQIYLGKGTSLLLGNYTILDKLGQGGMGMVLKAEHKRLKRLVAIKVLSPQAVKTPDALKRFHREVEAAAKLRHTNVVATDDADEAKGTHFLVMEYIDGSDLSALVKKKGPLSVEQAVRCVIQAARGLEFAHQQGVVHRDIKPANLLIDAKGTVKILDMGLARIEGDAGAHSELTNTGAVMGTVDYMAPEQALNTKSADARSDIYSLGISLWYLLTGKCAYDGDTMMAKLLAHRDSPIPSLRSVRADVPQSVDAAFQKMVAKQPQSRFQSMTEVLQALDGCHVQEGSGAQVALPTSHGISFSSSVITPEPKPARSGTIKGPLQATATYAASDPASEVTMPSSDAAGATDPQTLASLKNSAKGATPKTNSSPASSLWLDRRIQISAGAGALLLATGFFVTRQPASQPEPPEKSVIATGNGESIKSNAHVNSSVAVVATSALEFDGTTSYVHLPDLPWEREQSNTVEIILTPVQKSRNGMVFLWSADANNLILMLAPGSAGANWVASTNVGESRVELHSDDSVVPNKTIHLAVVTTPDSIHLFVDGKLQTADPVAGTPPIDPRYVYVGAVPTNNYPWQQFFTGRMHEIRISRTARYDKSFSPPDVRQTFAKDEHTLALYHCSEGQGDELVDYSGNGYHGKIVGAKWVSNDPDDVRPIGSLDPNEP